MNSILSKEPLTTYYRKNPESYFNGDFGILNAQMMHIAQ